jgi:CheY-like chemotaxis protein
VLDQPQRAAAAARAAADSRKLQVLVVDDNQDAADSLTALLELDGFEVRTVYDGGAAIAAVQRRRRTSSSWTWHARHGRLRNGARAAPLAERILMLALTGWGQADARRRTMEAGFDHHLVKPVELERSSAWPRR